MNQPIHSSAKQELDSGTRDALEAMLSTEPDARSLEQAIARIHGAVSRDQSHQLRSIGGNRLLITIAASLAFAALLITSSTESWAAVVADYQSANNEPTRLDVSQASTAKIDQFATDLASPILRFILLTHVTLLMCGLAMALLAWAASIVSWVRALLSEPTTNPNQSWVLRPLSVALGCYLGGTALGCVWSFETWGRVWSWDPREMFALVTFVMMSLWYSAVSGFRYAPTPTQLRRRSRVAMISTAAFGLIVEMMVLGGQYASDVHTTGFASPLPTILLVAFASLTGLIWLIDMAKTKSHRQTVATP